MRYTDRINEYQIDLSLPEGERWRHVISKDGDVTNMLFDEALRDFKKIPEFDRLAGKGLKSLFKHTYKLFGGRYLDEMHAWAQGLGRSVDDVLLLQCSYEFSQIPEYVTHISPFACTAGIADIEGLGLVHLRNLDWPLKTIGKATRVIWYRNDNRKFMVVGVPGLVGALSGMLPGKYSVTINYAPASSRPRFAFGPLFLLREVLEECDSYQDAVHSLSQTEVSSNVFFTVCGTGARTACVIERTPNDSSVRRFRGTPLSQANHFSSRRMAKLNRPFMEEDEDGASVLQGSEMRQEALSFAMNDLAPCTSLKNAASALDVEDVCNVDTHQQMAFCPRTGEYAVWRSY